MEEIPTFLANPAIDRAIHVLLPQFSIGSAIGRLSFVVASAFDFASAGTHSKILLWRTKMLVNASGIAMTESLPALITAAGPYFGKDMAEAEVLGQRLNRAGSTRLGPLEVKEYYDTGAAPSPDKESAPASEIAPPSGPPKESSKP